MREQNIYLLQTSEVESTSRVMTPSSIDIREDNIEDTVMTVEIIGESAPGSNLETIVLSTAENFATRNVSNERGM
jgi:hypothetical protein